jgi:hypothetical protein
MLGWEIFIDQKRKPMSVNSSAPCPGIASWRAGLNGTKWIDELVASGQARDLGQNQGYPCRYELTAGVLACVLRQGVPQHQGPLVIGDNYALPAGYVGDARIDMARLESLPADEPLIVEAWDQS